MRWPDRLAALVGCTVLAGIGGAVLAGDDHVTSASLERLPGDLREARSLRLDAVERTIALIDDKRAIYRQRAQARVRAYQRLEPAGTANLWFRADERSERLLLRAHVGRLLEGDFVELGILADEQARALRARDRARADLTSADPTTTLDSKRLLQRPVAGPITMRFGSYRDSDGVDLRSRGIWLAADRGDPVSAVAAGEVVWTGVVEGGTRAVLVEHETIGLTSFIGGLSQISVEVGQSVEAGEPVGQAAGRGIYLEIRVRAGSTGHPVDPEILLVR